jgi:protein SSD1
MQSKLLSLALYFVNKQTPELIEENKILATETTTIYGEARVIAVMEDYFDVSLPEFGVERRVHLANLPLWRHKFDPHGRSLTMFWKEGVIPSTGKQQQWSLSDDEYEEEELLSTYPEKSQSNTSSSSSASTSNSKLSVENNQQFEEIAKAAARAGIVANTNKRASKRASIISARLSTSTGYSSEQCSQTIKALDKVRVVITIEMVKTPPLIRIFCANPFA